MRICFLAPANNYHTVKWCKWFSQRGHDVHVISFTPGKIVDVNVHHIDVGVDTDGSDISKLKYLLAGKRIKRIIDEIKPDVVNAHYATSYGSVAAFAGLKNYIVSVWGSDIYDFPQKSPLHKALLKYSLKKATYLFSTSRAMAEEASKYTKKHFDITPFGVDMKLFSPSKRTRTYHDGRFVVGTVKGLSYIYGIDYLIKAVSIIKKEHPEIPIELRIAGKGENETDFRQLAVDLGIDNITHWLGFISQDDAANEWANMDVAVIASLSESFGVSAVEAQACGTAVVITDIPGLMEATCPGKSSYVIKRCDVVELADAIMRFYADKDMRYSFGKKGRSFVEKIYEINDCFSKIEKLYEEYRKRKA